MEFLDPRTGQNLARLLRLEGTPGLDWQRTLELVRPIAAALDYAHREHRLAHRNLKPENVFVTEQGIVKLLDFGLTYQPRQLRGGLSAPDTEALETMAESAATEQARFKQDIGALAALTYELLSARPPYQDPSAIGRDAETWPVLLSGKTPPRPAAAAKSPPPKPAVLTDSAWTVLHNALAYQSPACPATAGQLLQQLETAQQSVPIGKAKLRMLLSQRRPIALGLTGLLVLGVAGISSFSFWKNPHVRELLSPPSEQEPTVLSAVDTKQRPAAETGFKSVPHRANTRIDGVTNKTANASDATEVLRNNLPQRDADNRAFAAAQRIDTITAYHLYLQRCPNCSHQHSAEAAIAKLQRQTQIAAHQARLEKALQTANLNDTEQRKWILKLLKELAALDPRHPLLATGKQRIALVYAELAQTHLREGNHAEAGNWLAKGKAIWPNPEKWSTLTEGIKKAAAKAHDDSLYAQARDTDTPSAYQAYLHHCPPPCDYQQEAQTALERLDAKRIFRDALADGSPGPEMVIINAGIFVMGSPSVEAGRYQSEHQQQVAIKRPFAIGRYEVTFAEYDKFVEATGREKPDDEGWERGMHPVININWHDAIAYAKWLSTQTKQPYRLPTEAEWEYAARAGTRTARYWGNNPDQGCRYANAADLLLKEKFSGWNVMQCRDGYLYTAPVGSFQANTFGLFDMLGNVMEWTCSAYHHAADALQKTCDHQQAGTYYVARGGSWSDEPRGIRAADRYKAAPDYQDYFLGFRLVRDL
jgi:formylglycine-generating enzyme required for sulfatase activity/serine/threonine protein kinase